MDPLFIKAVCGIDLEINAQHARSEAERYVLHRMHLVRRNSLTFFAVVSRIPRGVFISCPLNDAHCAWALQIGGSVDTGFTSEPWTPVEVRSDVYFPV